MLMKSIIVSLAIAFLGNSYLANGSRQVSPSHYVRLEVKGTLHRKDAFHYVETSDGMFPDTHLIVNLERSEDKNRLLDRHLESLEGKTVIARGFLDGRRIGQENGVIYLYLSAESQVQLSN